MLEIIKNKKAKHEYEILKTYEAGLVLIGAEAKSIHKGKVNIKGSFCKFFKDELYVFDMNISKFEHSSSWDKHDEKRPKKLMLHRKELEVLKSKVHEDGLTIVPLRIYFNDKRKCKIEIGICKGKKNYDKKEDKKQKDIKRSIERDYKQKIK